MILWLGASENNSIALVKLIMKKEGGMKTSGMSTAILCKNSRSISTKLNSYSGEWEEYVIT